MNNQRLNQIIAGTTIPGAGVGVKSMNDVHRFNSEQIRRKGFSIRTGTGANTLDIRLPGTARMLCGILIYDVTGDPGNTTNLIINNDTRIEQVSITSLVRVQPNFADPAAVASVNSHDEEFFEMPTLLSGNDSITMEFNIRTAGEIYTTFYFI